MATELSSNIVAIDEYRPDYKRMCECCGQTPTVTAVKNDNVVYRGDMCGVCTWGEASMVEPDNWNS